MARVVALVPDLLFGSKVQAALAAAGHEVVLVTSEEDARAGALGADVLVVDLTTDAIAGTELVAGLARRDAPAGVRTLGFYSHVEPEVRAAAEAAGFDLVVPRSRMNREAAALVAALAGR